MAIQIGLYVSDSFAPIPLKIGPLSPYIEPNDPRGGIFALGNMCLHKPGSDGDLWVPLKFCHQGGARGPLLPTRLKQQRVSDDTGISFQTKNEHHTIDFHNF